MIAMELDGRHIGKTIKLTWRRQKQAQAGVGFKKMNIDTKKVTQIRHLKNGDVSVSQPASYYIDPPRYPPDADVEVLD